jgi:Family of unknown function (DUF6491)
MRFATIWLGAAAGFVLVTAAAVADQPKETTAAAKQTEQVEIPFANHGGIYSWQVESDHSVLIQDQRHKWYRATLMGSCFDLAFAERIGFQTNPSGSFDRFSQIVVRGQRCPLTSLVPSPGPAKKGKAPKAAPPAATAPAPTPPPAG